MWRFKTEKEFKEEGLWNKLKGCPTGWVSDMNMFLGELIEKEYHKYCEVGKGFTHSIWTIYPENYKKVEKVCVKVSPETCERFQQDLFSGGFIWTNGIRDITKFSSDKYIHVCLENKYFTYSIESKGVTELSLEDFYTKVLGSTIPTFGRQVPVFSTEFLHELTSWEPPIISKWFRYKRPKEISLEQLGPDDAWSNTSNRNTCEGGISRDHLKEAAEHLFGKDFNKKLKAKNKKKRLSISSPKISNNLKIK